MKAKSILFVTAIAAIFSSCSSNSVTPIPSQNLNFKKDFTANYDISDVDTSGSGHNADSILVTGRRSVTDIVIDTDAQWGGKTHVVKITEFQGTQVKDSEFFYQDPNGDLYRYNFGFNILNTFSFITLALGKPLDEGWVLAAKMNASAGTKWVARATDSASISIPPINTEAYFTSQGEMIADTSFTIGNTTVKARHARNTVTATAAGGLETGKAIIDSYYSIDINSVVEDFYRHASLSGSFFTQQAQGKFKIMTSYQK